MQPLVTDTRAILCDCQEVTPTPTVCGGVKYRSQSSRFSESTNSWFPPVHATPSSPKSGKPMRCSMARKDAFRTSFSNRRTERAGSISSRSWNGVMPRRSNGRSKRRKRGMQRVASIQRGCLRRSASKPTLGTIGSFDAITVGRSSLPNGTGHRDGRGIRNGSNFRSHGRGGSLAINTFPLVVFDRRAGGTVGLSG